MIACLNFARSGFRTFNFFTFVLPSGIKSVNILFFVVVCKTIIALHMY